MNHRDYFDRGEGNLGGAKGSEGQHRSRAEWDEAVILLDPMVSVFGALNAGGRFGWLIVSANHRGISVTFIEVDLIGDALALNGFLQEVFRRVPRHATVLAHRY